MKRENNSPTAEYAEEIFKEGKAIIKLPIKKEEVPKKDSKKDLEKDTNKASKKGSKKISKKMPVFYNPIQVFNRDLTLLMVSIYSKKVERPVTFLDTMAASGIRAVRLLLEQPEYVSHVFLNDLNGLALKYAELNLKTNKIPAEKYTIFHKDARYLLDVFSNTTTNADNPNNGANSEKTEKKFCDVIDVDPFGTPSQYIPHVFNAIEIGGMLCVTATDTPVLFGIRKIQCIRKYLTRPIKTNYLKEMGARILIYYVMKIAHLFGFFIKPLLTISADHYVRVFLQLNKSISGINKNIRNTGFYLHCPNCEYRSSILMDIDKGKRVSHSCPKCSTQLIDSGELWLGALHSTEYINSLKNIVKGTSKKEIPSHQKIKKLLELIETEDEFPPYYYDIPKIADRFNYSVPSMDDLMNEFIKRGYQISRTQFNFQGVKTNAGYDVVSKILGDLHVL